MIYLSNLFEKRQKKQTTKQESSSIGGGSSIVTNGFNSTSSDVNVFQAGFGRNEVGLFFVHFQS